MDFLSNKVNKYSIRKFTVGTASILVGATLMFGAADNEAKAAEDNQLESASKKNRKVVVIMKTQNLIKSI